VIAVSVVSPSWVYNATDTNAAALLAGCYLGVAPMRHWRLSRWSVPALVGLMFLPVFGAEGAWMMWSSLVAIGLGVLAVQHAVAGASWLEAPVLVWLGQISYGLYLWHYLFVRSDLAVWAAIPLSVAAAAASWYLVECPVRRLRARFEKRSRVHHTELPRVAYLDDYRRVPRPVAPAGVSPLPYPYAASGPVGLPRAIGGAVASGSHRAPWPHA
jgi:peptidoglycan/LPS O-acetylase OafA/YrhL